MIGIEDGNILVDANSSPVGVWGFTVYDGDVFYNEHGRVMNEILHQWHQTNLITTAGKGLILDRIFGLASVVTIAGTAVGTSATAAAVGDTAITGAVYQAFDATPTRSGLVVTAITTFGTSGANINIQEAGLLTTGGGTLLNRLAPVLSFTKTSAMSLAISTTISQS
jgi:hypothetical protein